MDPLIAASMIFTVILVLLIGGFVVLFPLTRRLGNALEVYLDQKREELPDPEDVERLRVAVHQLRKEVRQLGEKQEFVEKLLQGAGPEERAEGEGSRSGP